MKLPTLYLIHLRITTNRILVLVLYLLVRLLPQKLFLNCLQFLTPMLLQPLIQQILIHRRKFTPHLTHLILLRYVTHLHQRNILFQDCNFIIKIFIYVLQYALVLSQNRQLEGTLQGRHLN